MQSLSVADFALRLAVGVGCGALIGMERQWRARRAGLRTNALVAAGATLFVLYAVATEDSSPTRVASYVVSGIGFLGGGVILREGVNVRGLNTAATLWCSAAVGVLAASGHLVFTAIATGTVIAIHVLGRPLGRMIDRDNTADEDEGLPAVPGAGDLSPQIGKACPGRDRATREQQRHHAARYPHRAGHRRRSHVDRALAHGWPYIGQARAVGGGTLPANGGARGAVVRRRNSPTAELSIARQGRACSSGAAAASRSPRLPVSGG